MIRLRRAADRGHADHGWLKSYHTFSFAEYRDPAHQHFRALRVINEDWIAPGQGFGEHPHRDMEIVTYVLDGELEHRDSMGNGEVLRNGELQRMSAGSGVTHSEFNPSTTHPVHLYQIWLFPERKGIEPGYEQRSFHVDGRENRWQIVASPTGENESLRIHQDVTIYLGNLGPDHQIDHEIGLNRHAWLQILDGTVKLSGGESNEQLLSAGDGAAISDDRIVRLTSRDHAELMLFDLA